MFYSFLGMICAFPAFFFFCCPIVVGTRGSPPPPQNMAGKRPQPKFVFQAWLQTSLFKESAALYICAVLASGPPGMPQPGVNKLSQAIRRRRYLILGLPAAIGPRAFWCTLLCHTYSTSHTGLGFETVDSSVCGRRVMMSARAYILIRKNRAQSPTKF
jgi:hypothetical protein